MVDNMPTTDSLAMLHGPHFEDCALDDSWQISYIYIKKKRITSVKKKNLSWFPICKLDHFAPSTFILPVCIIMLVHGFNVLLQAIFSLVTPTYFWGGNYSKKKKKKYENRNQHHFKRVLRVYVLGPPNTRQSLSTMKPNPPVLNNLQSVDRYKPALVNSMPIASSLDVSEDFF